MKIISAIFTTFLLISFSLLTVSAQSNSKYTGALLWKITGNGLSQPSYILGTHHLVHVNYVDSISGLREVMENTQQTVGELLMQDQPEMQTKLQQASLMPTGETYKNILTSDEYTKLDTGLKELVMVGLDQLGHMKPGMLSMIYSITLYTKNFPEFNPMSHEGIDAYVQRIATENKKSVLGLETVEDQIYALFDSETLENQAKVLACAVHNKDRALEGVIKLNEYYKNKDLRAMYNLAFNDPDDPCKMSQTYQSAINNDRNNKWIQKLPEIMKSKSSLIAVGALHLAGDEGLLNQLAKKGYKVEAVK